MIETQFETPFGTGRVLIYNNHSARFWADKGSNHTLVINNVKHTVDIQIGLKDDGTWDMGYYEEPSYTNSQNRSWRRGFVDIKRADWIHSDKYASDSVRRKVTEQVLPAFIKFIASQVKLLAKAQRESDQSDANRLEAEIVTKREEIEELLKKLDVLDRKLGVKPCIYCRQPEDQCECCDQDVQPEGGDQ